MTALLLATQVASGAYPLTAYDYTGIRRLHAFLNAEAFGARPIPNGARMPLDYVRLRMAGEGRDFDITDDTPRHPQLQAGIDAIFADLDPNYSIAVLDITDPGAPRYAARNEEQTYLPGSIGKTFVTTGLFDALARAFPDPEDRLRVLRDTQVTADDFINTDSHTVPIVDMRAGTLHNRAIKIDDRFSLFEWVDHALSPSSNAAGATVWKQAILLRHFGADYPPSPAQEADFFDDTPKSELTALSLETLEEPMRAAGINTGQMRQGTMFTRGGRSYVPGVRSYASPLELLRFLLRIEQGRLIDEFSSLEIKRLIYYTKRRYRYAISPALNNAAVYFKSGSFYRCKEEAGFRCRKYAGNVDNQMNSIAIVENPAEPEPGEAQRVYLIALMSNVLRKNSAEDHRDMATEIDRLITSLHD